MRWPLTIAGNIALTIVLALGAVVLWSSRTDRALVEAQAQGDRIVEALEQYRRETGHYPPRLEDITPRYLPQLPTPRWGAGRWGYQAGSQGWQPRAPRSASAVEAAAADSGGDWFQLSLLEGQSWEPAWRRGSDSPEWRFSD